MKQKKKIRELYMQKELKRFKEGSKLYPEENWLPDFLVKKKKSKCFK